MRYDVKNIPESIIKGMVEVLAQNGPGAVPAFEGGDIYDKIARGYATLMGDPNPFRANLNCEWEKIPGSVYSIPHCPLVDKILAEYFNSICAGEHIYWYPKKTSKATIKKWLGDDFRGTMENPFL